MSFVDNIVGKIAHAYFQGTGKKQTVGQHLNTLQTGGQTIENRLKSITDSEKNRQVLSHIIGIERWGQQRLKVMLNEVELTMDEYNGYRPARDADWQTLQSEFKSTRHETLDIANRLKQTKDAANLSVLHNQHGNLSLQGWLQYLHQHSLIESKKIK